MYDFDTVVDRRNTGSLKWDVAENELPMWVADMDFKTAPQIIDAISERVSQILDIFMPPVIITQVGRYVEY